MFDFNFQFLPSIPVLGSSQDSLTGKVAVLPDFFETEVSYPCTCCLGHCPDGRPAIVLASISWPMSCFRPK